MIPYKYITDIDEATFKTKVVIPCINEDGKRTLLIKNKESKRHTSSYKTKQLLIKRNSVLFNAENEYFCHIISCSENNVFMNRNFDIMYNYVFKKFDEPIDEFEFSDLIISIEELFSRTKEDVRSLQIGIAGELLTLLFFVENGHPEILNNYHKNNFSKHDIEISQKKKLEVKTTSKESRIHSFSHSQLVNPTLEIFLSSVVLPLMENGFTLFDLYEKVMTLTNNYEVVFTLQKSRNYCLVNEDERGIEFSLELGLSNVLLCRAESVPQLREEVPPGVSSVRYDSVCEFVERINPAEVFK